MNTTDPTLSRGRQPWGIWPTYALSVPINLVIGYFAVFPLALGGYAVENSILEHLGWARGDGNVDEGVGFAVVVATMCVALVALVFITLNHLLRQVIRAPRRWYWLVHSLVLLTPFAIALVWSDAWT